MNTVTAADAPEQPAAEPARGGLSLGVFAALLAWPIVVFAVGAWLGYGWIRARVLADVEAQLRERPPIAVIAADDYLEPGKADAASVKRSLAKFVDHARKLSDAGYVVLDRQAVIDAPAQLAVKPTP